MISNETMRNGENRDLSDAATSVGLRNAEVIKLFFSLYLKDKDHFYSLWVRDDPQVLTPFITGRRASRAIAVHQGWMAVKAFWDPIFDEMKGSFDWFIDEMIIGQDPNVIVVKSHSHVDVLAGERWGNKTVRYDGIYVQIFKFRNGLVASFEEYFDTALLGLAYS